MQYLLGYTMRPRPRALERELSTVRAENEYTRHHRRISHPCARICSERLQRNVIIMHTYRTEARNFLTIK